MASGKFDINNIRSNLALGGIRPTLFQVKIVNPANPVADINIPFRVMASQLPASQLGLIQVPYMGRSLKNAGDRQFTPWTCTVIDDEDFAVRNSLEGWSSQINTLQGNVRNFGSSASLLYKSTATIQSLSKTGDVLREYTMEGIWPQMVSPITMNWGALDQIAQFEVTFEYDWWEVTQSPGSTPPTV